MRRDLQAEAARRAAAAERRPEERSVVRRRRGRLERGCGRDVGCHLQPDELGGGGGGGGHAREVHEARRLEVARRLAGELFHLVRRPLQIVAAEHGSKALQRVGVRLEVADRPARRLDEHGNLGRFVADCIDERRQLSKQLWAVQLHSTRLVKDGRRHRRRARRRRDHRRLDLALGGEDDVFEGGAEDGLAEDFEAPGVDELLGLLVAGRGVGGDADYDGTGPSLYQARRRLGAVELAAGLCHVEVHEVKVGARRVERFFAVDHRHHGPVRRQHPAKHALQRAPDVRVVVADQSDARRRDVRLVEKSDESARRPRPLALPK
mmetsp:Transcript_203/g.693  ORF Transcript_203/g.693 Transcript_203/m.693 type:complete len:321 (-) Transcript_203:3539-4501(-)